MQTARRPKKPRPNSTLSSKDALHPTLARRAALQLLQAVLQDHQTLDDTFAKMCESGPLAKAPARERGFARAIAATALRHLGEIDFLLDHFIGKPLSRDAAFTKFILRSAVAEIVFLKVPAYAAVNDAVAAARRARMPTRQHAGLINAVLRRIAEGSADVLKDVDAAELNTPKWAMQRWRSAYGDSTADDIARAIIVDAPVLDLTLKNAVEADTLAAELSAVTLPTGGLRLTQAGAIENLAGFNEGKWWVQDIAASLPAKLLGVREGEVAIDLCAAPGGKTAQLAALGAQVIAVERAPARFKRMKENFRRIGLKADFVNADMLEWAPPTPAPFVLLDAPCSASGTVRRHPDMLHLKHESEIEVLCAVQFELLERAAQMVSPGGRLIYCVCSLEKEEGEDVVSRFLRQHPDFMRDEITKEEIPGFEMALSKDGDLRTLPCYWSSLGGMDGFYISRLKRTQHQTEKS